jgi:hypothetical protein
MRMKREKFWMSIGFQFIDFAILVRYMKFNNLNNLSVFKSLNSKTIIY